MGIYLNEPGAYGMFQEDFSLTYYVDKSDIIKELIPLVELKRSTGGKSGENKGKSPKYVAVTRPRRFGKTVMANMIAAYFGKGVDSHEEFDTLKVSGFPWYRKHLNQHNVIHITWNEMPKDCRSYDQYIERIQTLLLDDLMAAYPGAGLKETDAVWDALKKVYAYYKGEKFIFVFDEWDCIFHKNFVTDADKSLYIDFLSNLLKDKAYVEMVYMTGILPIAKYSSGSELNMFFEFSMTATAAYSEYFGFTDTEVDALYQRYLSAEGRPKVTREGLKLWYDGYQTAGGKKLYNPRSVVGALTFNQLRSYWTSSGPYDEIFYYIGADVDAVKDDVALMVADNPVPAKVQEYAATSMELKTRDEIFSAMVVYGFLNYDNGYVSIPNKELMDKFVEVVQREPSLGNVYKLTRESGRMLAATKAGDVQTMAELMEYAHNTHSPLQAYSNEAELASIIRWVYLKALDSYRIEREDKAGIGYVDFIFYPFVKSDDAIIIELKVNHTADEAIRQIRDRKYALRFEGKFGENPEYTGRILAVGIAYHKDDADKRHQCKVEVIREKLK